TRPVLPVDIAVSPKEMAIVSVGSAHVPGESTVVLAPRPVRGCVDDFRFSPWRDIYVPGEITSVAWIHDGGRLLALSREPARLFVLDPSAAARTSSVVAFAALSDVSRADTGHAVFHANAGARTACASCHP